MMIGRIRDVRDPDDEVDGGSEGREAELAHDRITIALPVFQALERGIDHIVGENVHTVGVPRRDVQREPQSSRKDATAHPVHLRCGHEPRS